MALLFTGLSGLLVLIFLAARLSRASAMASLRAGWGHPVVRKRDLAAIAASHRSRLTHWDPPAAMDDRTWDDLNLDAVFTDLDRTESTLGQHALYHRLRSRPAAAHLDHFEALVTTFETNAALRERAQLALARLADPHGYDLWWLAHADAVETRSWYVLFPVLTTAALALAVLAAFSTSFIPVLVGCLMFNVAIRFATDGSIISIAAAFRQLAPLVATSEALRFLAHDEENPLTGPLRADTPPLSRLKTIARWISGDPLMLTAQPGSLAVLLNEVISVAYEYLNYAFVLDGTGVFLGARDLDAHRTRLLRVVTAAGDVDAAISTASFRTGRSGWTRPRFLPPGQEATLTEIRHPLVADAVPNSTRLTPGHGLLVTGSNMSGKSTFLRTVGVTVVMAQTLNTCLASSYEAPLLTVRSCIGRADDLLTGRSYYIVEVESLLELVEASAGEPPHLFLLDELFRGTNAVERVAAGRAVLMELVSTAGRPNHHVVLAATHDGELVDLLAEDYTPFHFADAVGADGLVFDHQLRPGPATTRNAIALLQLHGAPPEVIRRALECVAMLDAQRGALAREG